MPLVDLPLDQLRNYKGKNPRPSDFDDYWSRALDELGSTVADLDLQVSDFASSIADCHDLRFTGVRGARIYAKYLRPKGALKGAVLMFHGYSVNSGDWADKLAYASEGWAVLAMDVRGQGGKSEDVGGHAGTTLRGHIVRGLDGPPDDMFYRQVFLDTAQLSRIARELVDGAPIVATGASQGGGLALACAALDADVVRVAPWYPFLCDYQRVWEMDLARDAYDEMQTWFRRFDPTHSRHNEVFTQLGYVDVQHLTGRVRAKTLMGTGLMDQICPPSTQFAAFNKISGAKEAAIYPDFGHEGLPGFADRCFQFLTGRTE